MQRGHQGPHRSVGVHIPNSRGHTEAWEFISPTQGATPKMESPYPQLRGPHRSVGVHIPNSRGHTEVWESISSTQGATPKCGSPYPQLQGPHNFVDSGVSIPNSRGHNKFGFEICGQNPAFEKNRNLTKKPTSSYQKNRHPKTLPKKTRFFPKRNRSLAKKNPKPYHENPQTFPRNPPKLY